MKTTLATLLATASVVSFSAAPLAAADQVPADDVVVYQEADRAEREHERLKVAAEELAQRARAAVQAAEEARDAAREAATNTRDERRRAEQAEKQARRARAAADG